MSILTKIKNTAKRAKDRELSVLEDIVSITPVPDFKEDNFQPIPEEIIDRDYQDVSTTIGELQDGDLVMGTDGKWHEITILPIETKELFNFCTSAGNVICSYDHQWSLFEDKSGETYGYDIRPAISTIEILGMGDKFIGYHVGTEDGPVLLSLESIGEGQCRCIEVHGSKDHQYLIETIPNEEQTQPNEIIASSGECDGSSDSEKEYFDADTIDPLMNGTISEEIKNEIFTHNCQARMGLGTMPAMSSQMCFGNSLGTSIPPRKGAGAFQLLSSISTFLQFYFSKDQTWIVDWYRDHGMDKLGFPVSQGREEFEVSLGEEDEEFSIGDNDQHFEFEDFEKDVINRKEQKFRNL